MQQKFISIEGLYPDLFKYLPGWIKGTYYCITGATGCGKSKFARYSFAEWTYKYCKLHNIPFKIIYFALEESFEFFWTSVLLDKFRGSTGVQLTYYQYKGYHEGMTQEHQVEIDKIIPEIEEMKKFIVVIDDVSNPTGILRTVERELVSHGKLIKGDPITDEEGNIITKKTFVYNDPDFHLVIVSDHIGLAEPENNKFAKVDTLHLAISKLSEYALKIFTKRFNAIYVAVHQQEMAGENNDNFKLARLEPSETKLGDNKIVGRDYQVTLGLFNPIKYGLQSYLGYNMKEFGDHFRTLHVIKHRNGIPNITKALWFEGVGNRFEELPAADKKADIIEFIKKKKDAL